MNEEIIIHENQTTMMDFEYEIIMSFEEFNHRCMPSGFGKDSRGAEFDVRPNDIANKGDDFYKIITKNNRVYFKRIDYKRPINLDLEVLPNE